MPKEMTLQGFTRVSSSQFSALFGGIKSNQNSRIEIKRLITRVIREKLANAILSLAYGIPSAMVDRNIIRIVKRAFLEDLPEKPSQKVIQKIADSLSPTKDNQIHNYALLEP